MNIVDSSGWLEYFSDSHNADQFTQPLKDQSSLIVPSITIYEVFKVVLREAGENSALQAVAAMHKGRVVDLSPGLAMTAARISLQHNIPMADSIIFATAQAHDCVIWTLDADFKGLPNVKYFSKSRIYNKRIR